MKVADIKPGDVYLMEFGSRHLYLDPTSGSTFLGRKLDSTKEFMILEIKKFQHSEETYSVYAQVIILGEDTFGWVLIESKHHEHVYLHGIATGKKLKKSSFLSGWKKIEMAGK